MEKESDLNLRNVYGGATVAGSVVSAFGKIIEMLRDAGKGVGSSIRRISENNLCPLE